MYNVAAREVKRADAVKTEHAVLRPDHVRQRVVDHDAPKHDECKQRLELHSARYRAGDKRGGDDREHHLKCAEHHIRYSRALGVPLIQ